jgi:hypothetical protein
MSHSSLSLAQKMYQKEFDHLAVELRLSIARIFARMVQHALDAQLVHPLLQRVAEADIV